MSTLGKITRRTFMVASAAVVGGVLFGTYKYKQALPNPLLTGDDAAKPDFASLNPYLKIDQDGVTVITPRAEMGQGIHSTLAMLVACAVVIHVTGHGFHHDANICHEGLS